MRFKFTDNRNRAICTQVRAGWSIDEIARNHSLKPKTIERIAKKELADREAKK